ncbi:MAG: hypothetical protein HQ464_00755 [Planctomycetes bacterium]|nr:hypothetical protein [Planctomycetota bacterium]
MTEIIDEQLIAEALAALDKSIDRSIKQGDTVAVARPLYHEGLTTPRCVLSINGQDVRFFYRKATKRWVRA